jgi:squalene synthase HpnC
MTEAAADLAPRKDHKQENFPVASFVLRPAHRPPIMAFYRFARLADDISDHPTLPAAQKRIELEKMRASLAGESAVDPTSTELRHVLAERGVSDRHGLDLLVAFRQDVSKTRYADWAELMDYCRYSAMPVGRFVLDVHGESRATWPANDALCAALQVINHLQDCAKDLRELDRCYLSQDALAAAGATVDDVGRPSATPALRGVIVSMARKTGELLDVSRPFARQIKDARLAYEVALIQRLAEDLTARLIAHDPLSERVHHKPLEVLGLAIRAGLDQIGGGRRGSAKVALAGEAE